MRPSRQLAPPLALLAIAVTGVTVLGPGSGAAAQSAAPSETVQRTFVSTAGNDANPCTPAQPCRSFAAAIARTTPGGEVVALDSGGYGSFAVDRAIAVAGAPGTHAAVTAFTGTAVHVDVGAAESVELRNLYLKGLGASTGILFAGGRALHLNGVTVSGFTSNGLQTTASGAFLNVQGSAFHGNGHNGISVASDLRVVLADTELVANGHSGTFMHAAARANLVRVVASRNNLDGVSFCCDTVATVTESVLGENGSDGVEIEAATANLESVVASGNGNGVAVRFGGVVRLAGSTITGNVTGVLVPGGSVAETYGDNRIRGNTTNVSGSLTPVGTN